MMTAPLADVMGNITHALANGVKPAEQLTDESRTCEAHGEYLATGIRHNLGTFSRDVWSKCPTCMEDAALEESAKRIKAEQEASRLQVEALLEHTAIPPRFVGRTFENYRAER
jgi:DNA replication protein DnaC